MAGRSIGRHLSFGKKVFPFLLPFVLSFLPILILHFGRLQQVRVQKERFQDEWYERAIQKVELFRRTYSFEDQIRRFSQEFKRNIIRVLGKSGRELNASVITRSFRKAFPTSHASSTTRLYAFSFNEAGQPEILRGPGLSETRGKIIVSFLAQMIKFDTLSRAEKKKLNERCRNLFGATLTIELVAKTRKGFFIRGLFENARVFFVWDTISLKNKILGGFLMISPEGLESAAKPIELALESFLGEKSENMVPLLCPMESASASYKTIILPTRQSAWAITMWRDLVWKRKRYDRIASFGAVFEPNEDCWVLRSPVSLNFPYELWMVLVKPRLFLPEIEAVDSWLFVLWGVFWFIVILHLAWYPIPLSISVRQYFAGFMVLTGVVPLGLLLFVIGFPMIENFRDNRVEETIRQQRKMLEEADFRFWSKLTQFSELCRKTLLSPELKEAFCGPRVSLSHPLIKACFSRFRRMGVPLESLTVFQFGRGTVYLSDQKDSQDDRLGVYSMILPIMYGCYNFLNGEEKYRDAAKVLKDTERICIDAFRAVAVSSIYEDLALTRNNAHTFDFDGERVFTFFDFISKAGWIDSGVLFRSRPSRTFQGFLLRSLRDLGHRFPLNYYALGRNTPEGFEFVGNPDRPRGVRSPGMRFLRRTMAEVSRTGVPQVQTIGKSVFIAYPCQQMPGQVLGTWFSLGEIQKSVELYKKILVGFIGLLSLISALVAFGLARYFLDPLRVIEGGLRRVSEGDLEVRLGLSRDDELGEASKAFDEMIAGLRERRELGRFVSATLESSIRENHGAEVPSFVREGVVLAADIRNFTTLSEAHPPESIISLLNTHLDEMSGAIQAKAGLIDKFIGDAVVAVFWHDERGTALKHALTAALLMMRAHGRIQRHRTESGLFTYGMGVGIAMGELSVGEFGSRDRREYTVVGEVRTHAEELEASSKKGSHTHIVVDKSIPAQVSGFTFVPLEGSEDMELLDEGGEA